MEKIISNITAYFFLSLAIIGAVGVLFLGAWWHLLSVAICYYLYKSFRED